MGLKYIEPSPEAPPIATVQADMHCRSGVWKERCPVLYYRQAQRRRAGLIMLRVQQGLHQCQCCSQSLSCLLSGPGVKPWLAAWCVCPAWQLLSELVGSKAVRELVGSLWTWHDAAPVLHVRYQCSVRA